MIRITTYYDQGKSPLSVPQSRDRGDSGGQYNEYIDRMDWCYLSNHGTANATRRRESIRDAAVVESGQRRGAGEESASAWNIRQVRVREVERLT